jgi:hypothetical protein
MGREYVRGRASIALRGLLSAILLVEFAQICAEAAVSSTGQLAGTVRSIRGSVAAT